MFLHYIRQYLKEIYYIRIPVLNFAWITVRPVQNTDSLVLHLQNVPFKVTKRFRHRSFFFF